MTGIPADPPPASTRFPFPELALLLGIAVVLSILLVPRMGPVLIQSNDAVPEDIRLPIEKLLRKPGFVTVRLSLPYVPTQPTTYTLRTNHCLTSVSMNMSTVPVVTCPKHPKEQTLLLGPYLRSGTNDITVAFHVPKIERVSLDFFPSLEGNITLEALRILWLVVIVLLSVVIFRRWITRNQYVLLIVIAGIVLRWVYLSSTPYDIRSYDWWGHLDYVRSLAKEWMLPRAAGGWEFHQPPLYYEIAALLLRGCRYLGWQDSLSITVLQHLSLLISVAVLLAGTRIAVRVLGNRVTGICIATGILATLPALVMTASRISNDALVTLWIALGFLALLTWWERRYTRSWIVVWIFAALAFLTKINGIVLPVTALLLLAFSRGIVTRRKIMICLLGLLVFGLFTAWLPLLRIQETSADLTNLIMTGKIGLNGALCGTRRVHEFFTFNPVAVIEQPFVSTWSDATRRGNYFEFFLRSAFFGEFRFPGALLPRSIIALSLMSCLFLAVGVRTSLRRWRDNAPLLALSGVTFIISFAYAIIYRCYPEQDFRFSLFLALAGAPLLALGILALPRDLRWIGTAIAVGLSILCGWLLLSV